MPTALFGGDPPELAEGSTSTSPLSGVAAPRCEPLQSVDALDEASRTRFAHEVLAKKDQDVKEISDPGDLERWCEPAFEQFEAKVRCERQEVWGESWTTTSPKVLDQTWLATWLLAILSCGQRLHVVCSCRNAETWVVNALSATEESSWVVDDSGAAGAAGAAERKEGSGQGAARPLVGTGAKRRGVLGGVWISPFPVEIGCKHVYLNVFGYCCATHIRTKDLSA